MADDSDDIPLFEIDWDRNDILNAVDSITRGGYWANGPYIDDFESSLRDYLGCDYAIVVNSGTTALVAALHGLDIGPGDEVILPSFTFIATANAVELVGATPVFADIEPQTFGLDPNDVDSRITDDTAAVMPVHCYGAPCRISELVSVADDHDIPVVEDAAEALGAGRDGQKLGTFGRVGALSFCQNKIITTGEGGAIVTDDEAVAQRVRLYRSHGRASVDYFQSTDSGKYVDIGTNIRMSDMTAAIGCAQLGRIKNLISDRQEAAALLKDGLSSIPGVWPHEAPTDGTHVYQLFTVEFDPEVDRAQVIQELSAAGISSKVYWDPPAHRTAFYETRHEEAPDLPVTDDVADRVLSLPIHPNLKSSEVDRIIKALDDALTGV